MRHQSILALVTLLCLPTRAMCEETTQEAGVSPSVVSNPAIQKLDDERYQIGRIILDRKSRQIRFPCEVNMTEGVLEYLIVHKNGNTHESLLSTEISPTQLNLAFKLLNYSPSPELYALPTASGALSNHYPQVSAEVKAASRVTIHLEWQDQGQVHSTPVGEWIEHAIKTNEPMPAGPWVYGGSEISNGKYLPETTGDVCAILATRSALLNYPGEGAFDDTIWRVFSERVPKVGTKVSLIIAPYRKPPLTPSP